MFTDRSSRCDCDSGGVYPALRDKYTTAACCPSRHAEHPPNFVSSNKLISTTCDSDNDKHQRQDAVAGAASASSVPSAFYRYLHALALLAGRAYTVHNVTDYHQKRPAKFRVYVVCSVCDPSNTLLPMRASLATTIHAENCRQKYAKSISIFYSITMCACTLPRVVAGDVIVEMSCRYVTEI